MDAKCPQCSNVASVDEYMTAVKCSYCSFRSSYDDYIEIMKEITFELSFNYQLKQ